MAQSLSSADHPLANSGARADLIREAVRWIAEHKAEVKALNAEINEYMVKTVKGDLGFKIADFNAICRVSQLEVEDRDQLLECVREGFAALGIGQVVDWVDAAAATPRRRGNGFAEPNAAARQAGFEDGTGTVHYRAEEYPPGAPGHADYVLGLAEGEEQRDLAWAVSNGIDPSEDAPPPKRGRGRPRKPRAEDVGPEAA